MNLNGIDFFCNNIFNLQMKQFLNVIQIFSAGLVIRAEINRRHITYRLWIKGQLLKENNLQHFDRSTEKYSLMAFNALISIFIQTFVFTTDFKSIKNVHFLVHLCVKWKMKKIDLSYTFFNGQYPSSVNMYFSWLNSAQIGESFQTWSKECSWQGTEWPIISD